MEWNVNESTIEIEFEWHRGVIPVPSGTININWRGLEKELNLTKSISTDLAWEIWDETITEIKSRRDGLKFSGSYNEFLYPRGPSLGLNIYMPWSSEYRYSMEDTMLNFKGHHSKSVLVNAQRKYEKIAEAYDNMLAVIEKFVEDKIPEIMEEQEHAEEEMEREMGLI